MVKIMSKAYKQRKDKGLFYSVDGFLEIHAADKKFPNLRAKVKYITEELRQKVVKDETGILGVEYSSLPSGALYAYERGAEMANQVVSLDDFDTMYEAGDFADQASKDRGIIAQVVGSPGGVQQSRTTLCAGSSSVASLSEVGSSMGDTRQLPGASAEVDPVPGEESLAEEGNQECDDDDEEDSDEDDGSGDEREGDTKSVVSSAKTAKTKTAHSAQTLNPPAAPPNGKRIRMRKKGRGSLSEVKVVDTAGDTKQKGRSRKDKHTIDTDRKLYEDTVTEMADETLSEYRFKSEDIKKLEGELERASKRCSCLDSPGALDLATKLLELKDNLRPRWSAIEKFRAKNREMITHSLTAKEHTAFTNFKEPLQIKMLTSVGTASVQSLLARTDRNFEVVAFCKFLRGDEDASHPYRVTLSILKKAAHERTQAHLLVIMLEKLFKLNKIDFVTVYEDLVSAQLAPALGDVFKMAAKHLWYDQAWIDLSAGVVYAHLVREEKEVKKTRDLHHACRKLVLKAPLVSSRLKAFRGQKWRFADGNGDVGRFAWKLCESLTQSASAENITAYKKAFEKYQGLMKEALIPVGANPDIGHVFDMFMQAYDEDKLTTIIEVASEFGLWLSTDDKDLFYAETVLCDATNAWWRLLDRICNDKLCDSFKEALLGDIAPNTTDRIFLFLEIHTLFRKVDEAMACIRPCREAHDELSRRLGLVTTALQVAESTEKNDVVKELDKWSEMWLEQMKLGKVGKEGVMFKEHNIANLLKLLRSSSPEPLIHRFLVSQLSFEASTRSCKIHERVRALQYSLPEGRCQTLVQRALVADRAATLLEKIGTGSTKSRLCELASLRSEVQILKDETASWVLSAVEGIEKLWNEAFKEFIQTSQFADFPQTLKKYEDVQAAISDGTWNEKFPWVADEEHPEQDSEIASLQFALSHAKQSVKLALALLPHVSGGDKQKVQEIEAAANVVVKLDVDARITMASVRMACEVLKKPRTTVGDAFKTFVKETLSELGVKTKKLPAYVQELVNKATQEKAESKSKDVEVIDGNSIASSSQASAALAITSQEQPADEEGIAPANKKRRITRKLSIG